MSRGPGDDAGKLGKSLLKECDERGHVIRREVLPRGRPRQTRESLRAEEAASCGTEELGGGREGRARRVPGWRDRGVGGSTRSGGGRCPADDEGRTPIRRFPSRRVDCILGTRFFEGDGIAGRDPAGARPSSGGTGRDRERVCLKRDEGKGRQGDR